MLQSKLKQRLDASDEFQDCFDSYDVKLEKQVGLYEVESINNPNVITITINPIEYFELFRDKKFNEKHESIRKDSRGVTFEDYTERIMDLKEYTKDDKKNLGNLFKDVFKYKIPACKWSLSKILSL